MTIQTSEDYEQYLEAKRGSVDSAQKNSLYHTHVTQEFLHHESVREEEDPKTHKIKIYKEPDWDGKTRLPSAFAFSVLELFPSYILTETGVNVNDIVGFVIPAEKGGGLFPNYKKNVISEKGQSRKEALEALKQNTSYEEDAQKKQVEKL